MNFAPLHSPPRLPEEKRTRSRSRTLVVSRPESERSHAKESNFTRPCLGQSAERDEASRRLASRRAACERPTRFRGGDSTACLPEVGGCRKARWGWDQLLAGSRTRTRAAQVDGDRDHSTDAVGVEPPPLLAPATPPG
jgi:hypothetical protein